MLKRNSYILAAALVAACNTAAAGEVTINNQTEFDLELTVWWGDRSSGNTYGVVYADSSKTFGDIDQHGEVILEVCAKNAWCGPGGTLLKTTRLSRNGTASWTVSRPHDEWHH
jgi:hypothetical protein